MQRLAVRPESMERAVTPRTRAILVAHLFGSRMPIRMLESGPAAGALGAIVLVWRCRLSRRLRQRPRHRVGDQSSVAPYACPPDEAVHGVAVLEAIIKSAQSGQRELIG